MPNIFTISNNNISVYNFNAINKTITFEIIISIIEDIKNNAARNDKTQVNKIMKNGQVLILRNGVAYDMLGNIIDI